MRSASTNPFTPGSDVVPSVWAGRSSQLGDWRDVVRPRRTAGLPERGRTILGEAGLGKSTLVRRLAAAAEQDGDWVTPQLRVPVGADPLKSVASAVLRLADHAGLAAGRDRRLGALLDRVRSVEVSGIGLSIDRSDGPEPHTALTDLLVEVGVAALEHDVAVLLHVDEIQNVTDERMLSQLLICLGDAITHQHRVVAPGGVEVRRTLPLALYLTGLPDFADMAGARKGATFARRFRTTTLAPLDDDDLRLALHPFLADGWEVVDDAGVPGRVHMTPDAVEAVVRACCGEPFLFQLAGDHAWYAGSGPLVTADHVLAGWAEAVPEATAHVERILERVPERERQLLEAMASLEPQERTLSRIASLMGYASPTQAAPAAQRLDTVRGIIDRGKPYRFRHRAVEAFLTSDWPRIGPV